jgi:trimeric autotransporter adhesin
MLLPDAAQYKAFALGMNYIGPNFPYLTRFDTAQYVLEQQLQLPLSPDALNNSVGMVRWGQDGLAIRVIDQSGPSPAKLMLLRGPFVLPAEANTHPAPSLDGTDHTNIVAGNGNLYLNVTGSGLIPEAVVLWNGSQRTTTFTDSEHLQVAVPAADIANAQSVTLAAQNPSSATSNSIMISVQ